MRRRLLGVSAALIVGAGVGLACSDRDHDDACYERDAGLDWDGPIELEPYCEWSPSPPFEPFPDPPEGYANTWQVFVTFQPTDANSCDPCDVERFDALLEAQIEAQCDQPYVFVRGCYIPAEEFGNRCQVLGLYHSNCEAPTKE